MKRTRLGPSLPRTLVALEKYISARRERGPVVLLVILGLAGFALPKLGEAAVKWLGMLTGPGDTAIYATILAAVVASLIVYILPARRQILEPGSQLPRPERREQLSVLPIVSVDNLLLVQKLVHDVFGGATPPDAEIIASFKINDRRSIAIYSADEQRYVGFASIWPIRDDIAQRMISGEIKEEAFRSGYMMPRSSNQSANYALIPGIAVLDAGSARGRARARALVLGFRKFIREEFLALPGRQMTIFATAFSEDGEKWCRALGMELKGMSGGNPPRPLFARRVTAGALRRLNPMGTQNAAT